MAEVTRYRVTEPYLHLSCSLGEAPYWEPASNTVRFVDIVEKKLHTVHLSDGPASHKQWDLQFSIGTTADIDGNDDEFIFGGKSGWGVFNRVTGDHRIIKRMWTDEDRKDDGGGKPRAGRNKEERMRSNDGAVDARGRYFVGTMDDSELVTSPTDEGVLFRLDPDLSVHRVKENVTIPNGTSWSFDDKTMYFTDSPSGKIIAYPYDPDSGTATFSDGKVLFECPYPGGVPDGHCQDVEGYLWVACYGTGKVVRVDPASGKVVAEVELPTRCVTCPAIAGTKLFITSAVEEDPENFPWSTKFQGDVFMVEIGVNGHPLNKFKWQSTGGAS